MVKKMVGFSLIIFFIVLFLGCYADETSYWRNGTGIVSTENGNRPKVDSPVSSEFLSDKYFKELNKLFQQVKMENEKWYVFDDSEEIAATAVINQMMDDLEKKPDALTNHENFYQFFETFDENIRKLDSITERMHFFRNRLNSYSGAPAHLDDMIDLAARGEWKLFSSKFHRFYFGDTNGALNVKFLSADGRFEAVYNTATGKIVSDPANTGTYNYAPGSIIPTKYYKHNKYDKKPWKKWGNVKGFSYQDIMSLQSGHGSDEANNNYKKVERWIKQRKK